MNNFSPVQNDLFESFVNTPATPTDTPPVTTGSRPPVSANNVPTLLEYANKIANRVWPKEHTRTHNLRGIRWFSEYSDFGQLTLADIRRKHIYEFVEHLLATRTTGKAKRPMSQTTANKYMAAISKVISVANDKEIIDNPIKLKYEKVKNARPKAYTVAEEQELIVYLRDICKRQWIADCIILSVNTGMRLGEIRSINNSKVELSDDGKWLFLPEELCKAGEREVPLNVEARAAYERLKPIIDDVWSHRTFYWFMGKARRDVGKGEKDFVFHTCRHTAGSRLSNKAGANEFEIADILGHEDTRTTRRYVHTRKTNLLNAVEAI